MAQLLGNILSCQKRAAEILRWIRLMCAEPARRVLVLSERKGLLENLETLIKAADPSLSVAYYVGGMKEEIREAGAATARILLGTYAMASEAMNIKTLNTVILASPRKAIEQSTGRILRIRPDQRQVPPVIIDIIDTHSMYQGQWQKRLTYYRKCTYNVERWEMGATSGTVYGGRGAPAAPATPAGTCLIED